MTNATLISSSIRHVHFHCASLTQLCRMQPLLRPNNSVVAPLDQYSRCQCTRQSREVVACHMKKENM
jgi:hypothetical protein